jgi:hypothetical protein
MLEVVIVNLVDILQYKLVVVGPVKNNKQVNARENTTDSRGKINAAWRKFLFFLKHLFDLICPTRFAHILLGDSREI